MAIDPYIARGIAPIGADLPKIGNMLLEKRQNEQRNALIGQQNAREAQTLDLQQKQFAASQGKVAYEAALRQQYAEMEGARAAGPQAKAQYVAAQAQAHPDFAKTPFSQMPPDQAFDAMYATVYAQINGKPPEQQKYGSPVAATDAGGNPAFVRFPEGAGAPIPVQGYQPPPRGKNGMSVTTPDGTNITIGDGAGYGPTKLGAPQRNKLEDVFTNAQANMYALNTQLGKWKPEYSTYAGQVKAMGGTVQEKLGLPINPKSQQYVSDFNSWKSETSSLLSSYLNQLSGAAISPSEEQRLKAGFPNADDGPSQYKSKVDATMKRFALAQARAAYLLSQPTLTLDSVSLDRMGQIIADEANKLANAYKARNMNEDEAKQRAVTETRARFGLGN